MKTRTFFYLTFLFFFNPLFSQDTQLIVKQKSKTASKVNIRLSDSIGNSQIPANAFISSEFVYFLVSPTSESERPFFKESDLTALIGKINLIQGQTINQAKALQPFFADKKITSVLLTYRKSDLTIWTPFYFTSAVSKSDFLQFPETYYDDFQWFDNKNKEMIRYEAEKKYARMLEMIQEVLDKKESSVYFKHMSFYSDFTGKWPFAAISGQLAQLRNEFEEANQVLLQSFEFKQIEKMSSVIRQVNELGRQAEFYTSASFPKSDESARLISNTAKELTETLYESRNQFLNKKLEILSTDSYGKYKFTFFTDLIYNKILRSAGFSPMKGLFRLSKNLTSTETGNLKSMGWEQDFSDLIYALQAEQSENGGKYLFNPAIIQNLEKQLSAQPKPYFEVFSAANSATVGSDDFISYVRSAIKITSSFKDLQQLETMMICYNLGNEDLSQPALENLNGGLAKMNEGKWREAKNSFEYAIRQESMFAPAWFYLALCEFNLDEIFSAQSRIEKALSLAPDYLSPKLFLLEMYNNQGEYNKMTALCNETLQSNDLYLVHFWKATAHFQLKQYKDALDEIVNNCLALNPNQEESYFLQGDVYAAMKKYDLAKDSYLKTQLINPFETTRFNEKMKQLP